MKQVSNFQVRKECCLTRIIWKVLPEETNGKFLDENEKKTKHKVEIWENQFGKKSMSVSSI